MITIRTNFHGQTWQTPRVWAMNKKKISAVDSMLTLYDIDKIDSTNKDEMIHFIIAAVRGNRKLVECFVQKGFNVNTMLNLSHKYDWIAYTPLHCAVKHLCLEGVKVLLEYGANMTIQDGNGCSPLHLAYYIWENSNQKYTENEQHKAAHIIYWLLSSHKSFVTNPTDAKGLSHLHISCTRADLVEVTKLLLQKTDDVNAYDERERTALSFAALNRNAKVVQLLLDYGACINDNLLRQVDQILRDEFEVREDIIRVFETLVKHLKKLQFISYPVSVEGSRICARISMKGLGCLNKELKMLKEHKIDNDYDILFKSEEEMAEYVKNTNLEEELDLIEAFNRYPNYRFLLNLKFKEGSARNQISEQLTTNLGFITAAEFSKMFVKK